MTTSDPLSLNLTATLGRLHRESSDFDLNPAIQLSPDRKLQPSAVLIAVQNVDGVPHVILTERASTLKHHAGQVAFPGGKRDAQDINLEQTALREADEEIGLAADNVQVLGCMPSHETITGFSITPVLGLVRDAFEPRIDPNEVAEVFLCPLAHVTDSANFSVQGRRWRRQQRYYHTVPYGPYYIWGATAQILRALAEGKGR